MTLYYVRVKEHEYQVDVAGEQVSVNGKPVRIHLTPINQNGHFLLKTDTDQKEVHIQANGENAFMATIASRYFNIQVEQYQRRQSKKNLAVQGELTAPMPAKVIDVLVRPGEVVSAGQPLILLESMKMQMEVKSPANGMIEAVFVQAAAQVEKGARLVSIQNENPRIS